MSGHRPWLGGVCARIADSLGWSVYGIRAAVVLLAWFWPLITAAFYLLASWWIRRDATRRPRDPRMADWDRRRQSIDREWDRCGH